MSKKAFFFRIGMGTLLFGALFFFIFSENEQKTIKKTTVSSLSQRACPRPDRGEVGRDFDRFVIQNSGQVYSKNPLVLPLHRLAKSKNKTPDYAEFSDLLEQGLTEIKDTLPVVLKNQSIKKQADVSPSSLPPRLSEREIHNRIWPPEYVEGLRRIEAQLIQEGFVAEEKRNAFATDKNMYDFLLVLTEYAYKEEWITAEEHKNFTRGIREVLPETIEREKAVLRQTGTFGALLPGNQHFAASQSYRDTIRDFFDGLSYVFSFIETANAAWITKGDCYKDDNPFYFVFGPNLASFCCNCGLLCTPKCKFIEDCGTGGKGCNVHYGCLNFTCAKWPNAIWDKNTGICGCG